MATTDMACADPVAGMDEGAFLLALDAVTAYAIDEQGRLVLEDERALLTFAAEQA